MLRFEVLTFSKGCKCWCLLLLLFKLKTAKMFYGDMLMKAAMERAAFSSEPVCAVRYFWKAQMRMSFSA